jgi:cytochrome c
MFKPRTLFLAAVLGLPFLGNWAWAQMSPAEQRGRTFALANCARCHAIDKVSPSPLTIAPPFRLLNQKYPVESLAESLAEGIVTGHPTMLEFRLEADQVGDFVAFLKSLAP